MVFSKLSDIIFERPICWLMKHEPTGTGRFQRCKHCHKKVDTRANVRKLKR